MGSYSNVFGARHSIVVDIETSGSLKEESGLKASVTMDRSRGALEVHFRSHQRVEVWNQNFSSGVKMQIERTVRKEEIHEHYVDIPVKHSKEWDEFVEYLPRGKERSFAHE